MSGTGELRSPDRSLHSAPGRRHWTRWVRHALDPWARGSEPMALLQESLEDCDTAAQASQSALAEMAPATQISEEQRRAMDAASDGLRALATGTEELLAASQRARESMERARIVALNAGLDGTRLPAPAGKAVVAIAEDLRAHVSRAAEALDDHLRLLGDLQQVQTKVTEKLGQGRHHAASVSSALERSLSSQQQVTSALSTLGSRLQAAAGVDPEVDRELDELLSHTTALAEGLGRLLRMPSRRRALQRLLGPALSRLANVLRAFERSPGTTPP